MMTEAEWAEFLKRHPKELGPTFDESIYFPEEEAKKMGFTDQDIAEIVEFARWHVRQREIQRRARELNIEHERQKLLSILKQHSGSLAANRRDALIAELRMLDRI